MLTLASTLVGIDADHMYHVYSISVNNLTSFTNKLRNEFVQFV